MSTPSIVVQLREWLQQPGHWDGRTVGRGDRDTREATGFAALDETLPWGGWPRGALTEILVPELASGELALLLPVLRRRWSALIAPPFIPFSPALTAQGLDLQKLWIVRGRGQKNPLWAFEELLKSGAFRCVVAWQLTISQAQSRRLQLAAEAGGSCAFVVQPHSHRGQISAAALRLQLDFSNGGLNLDLFKCRGQVRGRQVHIPRTELQP